MEDLDQAKHVFEKVTLVCPECGKKPANASFTNLADGIVKEEISCCGGTGFVMVHAETGYVVDSFYKNAGKAGATSPAFIPLAFDSAAKANGAASRTIGWLKEKLPVDTSAAGCGCGLQGGFWFKLKQFLGKLWN